MMNTIWNKLIWVITGMVLMVQTVWWFPRLPDPMPSHFDAAGNVDGHMSKNAFVGMILVINAILLVVFPMMAKWIRLLPNEMINIPNRDYWLHPDRKSHTELRVGNVLLACGWMTVWLMMGIFQLTCHVAMQWRATIAPEIAWLMGFYFLGILLVVVYLTISFRIPSQDATRLEGVIEIKKGKS